MTDTLVNNTNSTKKTYMKHNFTLTKIVELFFTYFKKNSF